MQMNADAARGRSRKASRNYHTGHAAEDSVARHYGAMGYEVLERRYRAPFGEIDLILRDGAGLICVEVKASRNHDRARGRLRGSQVQRVMAAAQAYLADTARGLLTPLRFDLATVDQAGSVQLCENVMVDF